MELHQNWLSSHENRVRRTVLFRRTRVGKCGKTQVLDAVEDGGYGFCSSQERSIRGRKILSWQLGDTLFPCDETGIRGQGMGTWARQPVAAVAGTFFVDSGSLLLAGRDVIPLALTPPCPTDWPCLSELAGRARRCKSSRHASSAARSRNSTWPRPGARWTKRRPPSPSW